MSRYPDNRLVKLCRKLAGTPDAQRRDESVDYYHGFFLVTLNTRDNVPLLGVMSGRVGETGEDAPRCECSELGRKVQEVILSIPDHVPTVKVIDAIVMPEHLHLLLHLLPSNSRHLGSIVSGFMAGCAHAYWDLLGIDWRNYGCVGSGPQGAASSGGAVSGGTCMPGGAGVSVSRDTYASANPGRHASSCPNTSHPVPSPASSLFVPSQSTLSSASSRPGPPHVAACTVPDRDHSFSYRGPSLFVRGYNDTEAMTSDQVAIKQTYIRSNPERRMIKGQMHDVFAIRRNQPSRSWNAGCARQGFVYDRDLCHPTLENEKAWQRVYTRLILSPGVPTEIPSVGTLGMPPAGTPGTRLAGTTGSIPVVIPVALTAGAPVSNPAEAPGSGDLANPPLLYDYMGNRAILLNPRKVSLICHRADNRDFELQKEAVLREARQGAVVVSAFVSPKERDILRQLLQEQLLVIEVMANGFPKRYKPFGLSFYASAEHRLLQVSCWRYRNQKDEVVTREMCLVMNQLVRCISGVPDDWWKGQR